MRIVDWKEEAQKQASAAGDLKIQLAIRLSDIVARIHSLNKQATNTEDPNMLTCILNRISFYEEEKRWIQSVLRGELNGKRSKGSY